MSLSSHFRLWVERILVLTGAILLIAFVIAQLHRAVMLRLEMERFKEAASLQPKDAASLKPNPGLPIQSLPEDTSASVLPQPPTNKTAYVAGWRSPVERPIAVLRIPKLRLEVPVLNGTDAVTLNRGVGRIQGTAFPGQLGNIGIAGHRDGFFRELGEIERGDKIELHTVKGTDTYVVERTLITDPTDLSVLQNASKPTLTLVTCYPFHYIGPAPRRFVVEASLKP